MAVRCGRCWALGLALWLLPGSLAALVVAPVTEGTVEAAPRSVAAFSFQVVNNTPEQGLFHWSAAVPAGWAPFGPVAGEAALAPGEVAAVLLLLAVPAGADPVGGEVRLSAWPDGRPEERAAAAIPFRTAAFGRLVWRPNGALSTLYEGESGRLRAYLENAANIPVRVVLVGTASLGGKVGVPAPFTLAPGAGRWVEATVAAGEVSGARETETIFLFARTADLPEPGGRAAFRATRVVLGREVWAPRWPLRGRLVLEGVRRGDEETAVGGILRLAGDLDPHRRADLRVGEALPIGEPGAFARRETSLRVEDDRWGGYLVGRTSLHFTRLTGTRQWGDWASLWADTGLGTFRAFSSLSSPQEVRGRMAGVEWSLPGARNWGLKALAYRGDQAPNIPGQSFALGTLAGWARLGATTLEGEVATARVQGAGKGASGWRLAGTGQRGRLSWAGEARRAAAGFPGDSWNENLLWASAGYRVLPRLEVFGTRQRLLSPNLALAPAADESSWEGGLRWQAWDRAWLSVGRRRTGIGVTVSEPVAAVERLWTGRLDLDVGGGFVATARIAWGVRREAGVDENLTTAEYSLRYRPSPILQITARLAPAPRSNAAFAFRDRWTLESRWQISHSAWLSLEGQGLSCGPAAGPACENDPTYRLALGTGLGGRFADWSLTGYAQRVGGDHEVVAGIQLGRAIAVRSPFGPRTGRVEGVVRLPGGSPGPSGVRVRLDGLETATDHEGAFIFAEVPPGDYAVRVVLEDLGLVWITSEPVPPQVSVVAGETARAAVGLTRPGVVAGQVSRRLLPANGNGNGNGHYANGNGNGNGNGRAGRQGCGPDSPLGAAPPACWPLEPFAGLGIRLTNPAWPGLVVVAVSDAYGRIAVGGLLPGRWVAEADLQDVPSGLVLSWQDGRAEVEVRPGATASLPPLVLEAVLPTVDITAVDPISVAPSR